MTSNIAPTAAAAPGFTVDDLEQQIRRVPGWYTMSANALAQALMPFVAKAAGGAWHEAVLEQCAVIEAAYVEADPQATLRGLIDWHVRAEREPVPGALVWPLRARIWTRTSQGFPEKILEIEGVIGETHMTCRFPQSAAVADEDVPELPEYTYTGPLATVNPAPDVPQAQG